MYIYFHIAIAMKIPPCDRIFIYYIYCCLFLSLELSWRPNEFIMIKEYSLSQSIRYMICLHVESIVSLTNCFFMMFLSVLYMNERKGTQRCWIVIYTLRICLKSKMTNNFLMLILIIATSFKSRFIETLLCQQTD